MDIDTSRRLRLLSIKGREALPTPQRAVCQSKTGAGSMKKSILACTLLSSLVAGCSNATRTVPVLVVDERTISGDYVERPRLEVPKDRNYLPPPTYETTNQQIESIPLPPPRPYDLGQKTK